MGWLLGLVLCVQTLCAGQGWAQGAGAERRTALVIGNSAYPKPKDLPNPVNDAQAMATTLKSLGFTVDQLENAAKDQMAEAIQRFGAGIKRGGVGLFYFAGHGAQVDGKNFLLPIDRYGDGDKVREKGVEAQSVLLEMGNAKNRLNIVILDACRNDPFGEEKSRGMKTTDGAGNPARSDGSSGLAAMEALVGTLIAFATAPGSTAADGSGKNGVYTENLLRHLTEPGLKIEDVFKRTRFAVRKETDGKQVPWENTSLESDFYFSPPVAGNAGPSGSGVQTSTPGPGQQAALSPSRSEKDPAKPTRGAGFSFSREEAKDEATGAAKDDAIRARLQAACPEALRRRPIVIDITEESESRAAGLRFTENSTRFAELVQHNLQQAGLTTTLASAQGRPALAPAARKGARAAGAARASDSYAIQGVVLSQQGSNRIVRLNEASVNAELVLRDPAGRIITMVEVSGERFAGQNTRAATWALTKEQANDASSQLYAAFCGARN